MGVGWWVLLVTGVGQLVHVGVDWEAYFGGHSAQRAEVTTFARYNSSVAFEDDDGRVFFKSDPGQQF